MKKIIELEFGELGYIANPYWPEVEWLFQLEKAAKVHPRHGDDKRKLLIETHCKDKGIAIERVEEARRKIVEEKWYRVGNVPTGNIYIPHHQFAGCLVQSLQSHALKSVINKDAFRSFVTVGHLFIEPAKKKADGTYDRYVKNPETNLRRLQSDEYIANFVATGDIHFRDDVVEPEKLESLIKFAGEWVGVGAARKMGRGKYKLIGFD